MEIPQSLVSEQRAKASYENALKRVRQDISDGILEKKPVTKENIWTTPIPAENYSRGWYQFKADEILQHYLQTNMKPTSSILSYIKRLRRVRIDTASSISYPKTVGGGKISMNGLFFIMECKALILENRFKPITMSPEFLHSRGFILPKLTTDETPLTFSQNQLVYNIAVIQRFWNQWVLPVDVTENLINYLQFHVAILILSCKSDSRFFDGIKITDFLYLQQQGGEMIASLKFINEMSCLFLGLIQSHQTWREVFIEDKEMSFVDWNSQVFKPEDREKEWFSSIPDVFFDWFENESKNVANSAFREKVIKYTQAFELRPGEDFVYLARCNNVSVDDIARIFRVTRTVMECDWWARDALEQKIFINLRELQLTGRKTLWIVSLILLFDSHLRSKCKFEWQKTCFYSERRFRENFIAIISSSMPMVVQIKSSFYVYLSRKFYVVHTIDRAIYLWTYLMKSMFRFSFKDYTSYWDLSDLQAMWFYWTSRKVNILPSENAEEEDPVFTTYTTDVSMREDEDDVFNDFD